MPEKLLDGVVIGGARTLLFKPVEVQVANTEQGVPIRVFGLRTIEAQIVSHIGFETAGPLSIASSHTVSVQDGQQIGRYECPLPLRFPARCSTGK